MRFCVTCGQPHRPWQVPVYYDAVAGKMHDRPVYWLNSGGKCKRCYYHEDPSMDWSDGREEEA